MFIPITRQTFTAGQTKTLTCARASTQVLIENHTDSDLYTAIGTQIQQSTAVRIAAGTWRIIKAYEASGHNAPAAYNTITVLTSGAGEVQVEWM